MLVSNTAYILECSYPLGSPTTAMTPWGFLVSQLSTSYTRFLKSPVANWAPNSTEQDFNNAIKGRIPSNSPNWMMKNENVKSQAYHPLFVWSTVLLNGPYGYEFWIAFLNDVACRTGVICLRFSGERRQPRVTCEERSAKKNDACTHTIVPALPPSDTPSHHQPITVRNGLYAVRMGRQC